MYITLPLPLLPSGKSNFPSPNDTALERCEALSPQKS